MFGPGVTAADKEKAKALNIPGSMVEEISVNNSTWKTVYHVDGKEVHTSTMTFGQEEDKPTVDGRSIKVSYQNNTRPN